MQFTKIFSIIALAATGAQALPEPLPLNPISVSGNFTAFTDAAATIVVGLETLTASDVVQIKALIGVILTSVEADAVAAASAIATIVGGTQVYANAVLNVILAAGACIAASA